MIFYTLSISLMFSQTITKENIESAEKIIGLEFNDEERDSMLTYLDTLLVNYENIRKVKLANSIPPAVFFNPIPVGFKFPVEQKELKSNRNRVEENSRRNTVC